MSRVDFLDALSLQSAGRSLEDMSLQERRALRHRRREAELGEARSGSPPARREGRPRGNGHDILLDTALPEVDQLVVRRATTSA
jgi:hypothetical protein